MSNATRRIVITGVSRGLGRSLIGGLVERGHTVCGCARSIAAVERLQQRWPAPNQFRCVDVADEMAVAAWAEQVIDTVGPPDLLLNNAAITSKNTQLWKVPSEVFSQVIDTNIKGVVHVLRHFVPSMVERGEGIIVNFSSGWGRSVSAEVAPYCATKWAIEGLTRVLALELPAGMAAVPVNPGIINTRLLQTCFGEAAHSYVDPQTWSQTAIPFLLRLGPKENGRPLSMD